MTNLPDISHHSTRSLYKNTDYSDRGNWKLYLVTGHTLLG